MIWSVFEQASCLPSSCGCEHVDLSHWIRQVSNFYSSFFYIIPAFIFPVRSWVMLCVLMTSSSLLAHASFVQFIMAFDFTAIIMLITYFPLLFILSQWRKVRGWLLLFIYSLTFLAMSELSKWPKIILCIFIFLFSLFSHHQFLSFHLGNRWAGRTLLSLGIGFLFFFVDELKFLCDPRGLFQFHGVWHFMTALALSCYGKWILERRKLFGI